MALNLQYAKIAAPRGPGRPPGTMNAINSDVRAMILGALNRVGGERYLARQAEQNPNAFMSLVGRVLPTKIANEDGSPIQLHLLAAQLISAHIIEQAQSSGQPIVDTTPDEQRNLLDAPPPTE